MKKTLTLLLLLFSTSLHAHFTHFEPRIIHIYQEDQDAIILMRMPLPLVLLDENWKGIDSEQAIPYTQKINTGDTVDYLINHQEVKDRPALLEAMITDGYKIRKNNHSQYYSVDAIHIFNTDTRKPFNSVDSALENFTESINVKADATKLFDSGIDILLRVYNTSVINDNIDISSLLGDRFNAINRLANIINLHRDDYQEPITTVGILDYSSTKQPSFLDKFIQGFNDGFIHILIGLDHVLFVILLFYSAPTFLRLLSLATAFTVGHSFSLFFGNNLAIASPIFTPGIELLIAITIAISAAALLINKAHHLGTTPLLIIGVIHGFGFSFVFNELEQAGGQTSLTHLISFNVGIELGQLFIYFIAFGLTRLIQKHFSFKRPLSHYVSIATLIISAYWISTRSLPIFEYISA